MKYWWKGLEDVEFLGIIHPKDPGSTKAGWYASRGRYFTERVPGVDNRVFAEAVNAEMIGCPCVGAGANFPLHWSSVFNDEDIFGNGKPPSCRFLPSGLNSKKLSGSLPVAEKINANLFGDPWFKHCDKPLIDRYIEAVHKVAKNIDKLRGLKPKDSSYSYWSRVGGV
jgi:hypothetical protein